MFFFFQKSIFFSYKLLSCCVIYPCCKSTFLDGFKFWKKFWNCQLCGYTIAKFQIVLIWNSWDNSDWVQAAKHKKYFFCFQSSFFLSSYNLVVLYITAANLHFLADSHFENSFGILYDGAIRLPNFKSFQSETAEIKMIE